MKKILFFGCGSIGQRHIRALKRIGRFDIAAYRTKKGFCKKLPKDIGDIKEFLSEKAAFEWGAEYAVIANCTDLHMKYLIKCIRCGIKNIFVEKPLCVDLSELKKNKKLISAYKGNISVGFNLRYHPVISKLRDIIRSGKYGSVLKATLEAGHYLPKWHTYEDYRKTYAAKKKMGGGVLRTLCHEIDLAGYFFGDIKSVYGKISKISDMEIDTDDNVLILTETKKGNIVEIKIDYLRPKPERKGEIFFKKGLLRYDVNNLAISFIACDGYKEENILSFKSYDYNEQYISQMKDFINAKKKHIGGFRDGEKVMEIIDSAERSSKKGKKICLN